MRTLLTSAFLSAYIAAAAQPVGCDDFHACFVPNALASGNYFFDNCTGAPNAQFAWDFGDGSAISTSVHGEHTYLQPGTYDVCLTVYWQDCSDTECMTITVSGGDPCANMDTWFTWEASANGIQFYAMMTGQGTQTTVHWDFGDGTTSEWAEPFHTYAGNGSFTVCMIVTTTYTIIGGSVTCSREYCAPVQIGAGSCDPGFTVDLAWNAGSGGTVFFSAASTLPGANFIWYFGDGAEGSGAAVTHTYQQSGPYGVCVTGWYYNEQTQDTCWAEDCALVLAEGAPCDGVEACFTPNFAQQPNAFWFENCSTPEVGVQYVWDFGDGSTSTAMNPEHVFIVPGNYEVCLTVHWQNCSSTICHPVVVPDVLCGDLMANFGSIISGNVVEFQNATTGHGPNTMWSWTFGDGATSNAMNPGHTYALPGTYEACLTATSVVMAPDGSVVTCQDTYCFNIVAFGGTLCTLVPEFYTDQGMSGVQFNNTSTGLGQQTTYQWDFGDGSFSDAPNPFHIYPEPGTYHACLEVTTLLQGPNGILTCQDSTCADINVAGGGPCDQLQACFEPQPFENGAYFFMNCTQTPLGIPMTYLWDFGDGSTSTAAQPDHVFGPGVYTVCLLVVQGNCSSNTCASITVVDGDPCALLNATFEHFTSGLGVNFSNATTGIGTSASFTWQFGDGTTSNDPQPFHVFPGPGIYDVCLTAVSSYIGPNGQTITCTDTYCAPFTVGGGPCADFNACFVTNYLQQPGAMFFDNCSSNQGIGQFVWDFGDGTSSTVTNAEHIYTQNGTYTVCLTAYFENCVDSTCTTVVVDDLGGGPCDQLDADFTTTPNGLAIQFISNTSGASPQSTFTWSFGDGSSGTGPNPMHDYAAAGVYEVCLQVVSVYEVPGQGLVTCADQQCYGVDVGFVDPCAGLVACFEALPFENGAYLFENCSQTLPLGIPVQYFWDFGDGATSNEGQPDHAFAPGTYNVCHTIIQGNCVDTTCTMLIVGGGGPCGQHQANFASTALGLAIQFASTSTGITENTEYTWSFGDGATAGGPNPLHDYAVPGVYEVCLTINTIFEAFPGWPVTFCSDSICYTVEVGNGDPCSGLVACFEALPFENGAYLFENCSQELPIDVPAIYQWSFGDGATSDAYAPDHSFTPGTYTVCLTLVHSNCTDQTCTTITVLDPNDPCAGLSAGFTAFQSADGVQFSNTTGGTGLQTTFLWSFGDGTSSTQEQPFHSYQFSGTYEVCVVATSIYEEQGQLITCTDEYCAPVIINSGGGDCDPNYTVDFTWTSTGTVTIFTASANLPTVGYIWHFGDNSDEGYGTMITHLYEPPGPYEVCLDAWYWNPTTEDTCWTYQCDLVDPFDIGNGIADIAGDGITVFPVPAAEVLTITGLTANTPLSLFAADGRLVLSASVRGSTHSLDVGGLAKGGYVLRVVTDHGTLHHRVIVE